MRLVMLSTVDTVVEGQVVVVLQDQPVWSPNVGVEDIGYAKGKGVVDQVAFAAVDGEEASIRPAAIGNDLNTPNADLEHSRQGAVVRERQEVDGGA